MQVALCAYLKELEKSQDPYAKAEITRCVSSFLDKVNSEYNGLYMTRYWIDDPKGVRDQYTEKGQFLKTLCEAFGIHYRISCEAQYSRLNLETQERWFVRVKEIIVCGDLDCKHDEESVVVQMMIQ